MILLAYAIFCISVVKVVSNVLFKTICSYISYYIILIVYFSISEKIVHIYHFDKKIFKTCKLKQYFLYCSNMIV